MGARSSGRLLAFAAAGLGVPLAAGIGAIVLAGGSGSDECSPRPDPTDASEVGTVAVGPDALPWRIYEQPVEEEPLRHNRLHGGIVIQYGAGVPAADVRGIAGWYDRDPVALLVAPQPELGDTVRASAWAGRLDCSGFDEDALVAFRDAHRFRGPERVPRAQLQPALEARIRIEPHPVRNRATISFTLLDGARADVVVRDRAGRTVRRLGSFVGSAGQRLSLRWDVRDDAGARLPPGAYDVLVRPARRTPASAAFMIR